MQQGGLERAVSDYFMVVRGPVSSPKLQEPAGQVEELLRPYEEALLLSANEYRERPKQLSRIDYTSFPLFNKRVNHLQFIAGSGSDPHSIWGVEMRLKEPRQGFHLWMPTLTTFVRMDASMADLLRDWWISLNRFLYPRIGESSYDPRRLNGGISCIAVIETNPDGQIERLFAQSQEEIAPFVQQEVVFARNGRPIAGSLTPNIAALQTARQILGNLPIDTVEYRGKPNS